MKIYFMRHGESEYNVNRLVNGNVKVKVPLTELGIEQAREAGKKLANKKIEVIFASPFLRTLQTAEAVNRYLNVKIIVDKRLREINFGFEGKNVEEYREMRRRSDIVTVKFRLMGKESFLDVKKRAKSFIAWLKKQDYENVLIVGHEIIVQSAFAILGKMSDEKAFSTSVKNCECFRFYL